MNRLRIAAPAVASLIAALLLPAAPASAGPSSVALDGRGYGHGRGMSQYGAQHAAADFGRATWQILRFYYPGTASGTAGGSLRVKITADSTGDVVVQHTSGLLARSVATGTTWALTRDGATRWRLTANGSGTRISVLTGSWHTVRDVPGAVEFTAGSRPLRLYTPSGEPRYRGALRSAPSPDGRDTVNVVELEPYLRGVVPREMPASWHPAAVRAQAIAARTYAAYERQFTDRGHFDVWDTTASQAYGGVDDEHPDSDVAVASTAGRIRTYDGAPSFTQFSSSNGGWSVAGSLPYQQAKQDRWDPVNRWRTSLQAGALERAYPAIGDFQRLAVLARDGHGEWGGRVLRIRVVGARGSVEVSGDTFRARFGLRSTWFQV